MFNHTNYWWIKNEKYFCNLWNRTHMNKFEKTRIWEIWGWSLESIISSVCKTNRIHDGLHYFTDFKRAQETRAGLQLDLDIPLSDDSDKVADISLKNKKRVPKKKTMTATLEGPVFHQTVTAWRKRRLYQKSKHVITILYSC